MPVTAKNQERRRYPRYALGLPVRLQTGGDDGEATTIELADVSFRGCRLSAFSAARAPKMNARVAFGFVLPSRRIALAKGRVVRHIQDEQGNGVGLAIEHANAAFYEFMLALSENEGVLNLALT